MDMLTPPKLKRVKAVHPAPTPCNSQNIWDGFFEDVENGSIDNFKGNTKKLSKTREPSAIWWDFTAFGSEGSDLVNLLQDDPRVLEFAIQEEVCPRTKKDHLQGKIRCPQKIRPIESFKTQTVHWSKSGCKSFKNKKGEIYCLKTITRKNHGLQWVKGLARPLEIIWEDELRPWQLKIYHSVCAWPTRDDRTIYWYWESEGNVGKTFLCKFMMQHMNGEVMVLSGKASDCFYALKEYYELHMGGPKVLIFDIPRSQKEYVSWKAIEKIKDGIFFSGKFKGGVVMMNTPHIICFANSLPDVSVLSADRWKIKELVGGKLVTCTGSPKGSVEEMFIEK